MLLWNRTGEYFHDLAPLNPAFNTPYVSRGLAFSDYDLDGDLDLAIADLYEGVRLLRKDMPQGSWIQLRLRSRGSSGEISGLGQGATVWLTVGELTQRRTVTGASYLSQSTRTLHFGLGSATDAGSVEVRWLGGETETWEGLELHSPWELSEGSPEAAEVFRASVPSVPTASAAVADMTERESARDQQGRDRHQPRSGPNCSHAGRPRAGPTEFRVQHGFQSAIDRRFLPTGLPRLEKG